MKCFSVFTAISVVFLSLFSRVEGVALSKQELWDNQMNVVVLGEDGNPLSAIIKEAHTACTLMDVPLAGGRTDGDYPLFRFVFESQTKIQIAERVNVLYQDQEAERKNLEATYPDFFSTEGWWDQPAAQLWNAINNEIDELTVEYEIEDLRLQKSVLALLEAFYQNHYTTYDRVLVFDGDNLQSVGAKNQYLRDQEQRDLKHEEYVQEIQAFTTFLKAQFFASTN